MYVLIRVLLLLLLSTYYRIDWFCESCDTNLTLRLQRNEVHVMLNTINFLLLLTQIDYTIAIITIRNTEIYFPLLTQYPLAGHPIFDYMSTKPSAAKVFSFISRVM